MTWNCPDCDSKNSDESIWCTECGQEWLCEFDGAPVEEAERDLADGGTQTVIQCSQCHGTKHRFDAAGG